MHDSVVGLWITSLLREPRWMPQPLTLFHVSFISRCGCFSPIAHGYFTKSINNESKPILTLPCTDAITHCSPAAAKRYGDTRLKQCHWRTGAPLADCQWPKPSG